MPIFPLAFDDLRRRRMAEGALTPPINPDAPAPVNFPNLPAPSPRVAPLRPPSYNDPVRELVGGELNAARPAPPDLPSPSPAPMMAAGAPGAVTPPPVIKRPPSRYEEVQEAKDAYLQKTPGRFKSAALGALRGFGQGMASGGGLGAGLGGLAAGAAFGGINPRGQREMEFDERVKPKIAERFAYEDADRAAKMAAEKALREDQAARAGIANINSQIQSRGAADALNQQKADFEQNEPTILSPGQVLARPGSQPGAYESVFTAPPDPRQGAMTPDQAEAALTSEEGTVEEVSQGSLRGRMESLKGRLTPEEQRLAFGGATANDDPRAITSAQAKWEKIHRDELESIRRDTGERRKAKVSQRRYGRKGTPGRTAISVKEAADLLR